MEWKSFVIENLGAVLENMWDGTFFALISAFFLDFGDVVLCSNGI